MDRPCLAYANGLCDRLTVLDVEGRPGARRRCFCATMDDVARMVEDPVRTELLSLLARTVAKSGSLKLRAEWHDRAEAERLRRTQF